MISSSRERLSAHLVDAVEHRWLNRIYDDPIADLEFITVILPKSVNRR
jgi:hypothetical protein